MSYYAKHYKADRAAAEAYYDLCAHARALGIPTSVDDPDSPKTVAELEAAVAAAEAKTAPSVGEALIPSEDDCPHCNAKGAVLGGIVASGTTAWCPLHGWRG